MVYGEYELVGPSVGFNDILLDTGTAGLLRDTVAQEFLPVVRCEVRALDETVDITTGRTSATVLATADEEPRRMYLGATLIHLPEDTWRMTVLHTQVSLDDVMNKYMTEYRVAVSMGMVMEAWQRSRLIIDMAAVCIEDVLDNRTELLRREAHESPMSEGDAWELMELFDAAGRRNQIDGAPSFIRYLP